MYVIVYTALKRYIWVKWQNTTWNLRHFVIRCDDDWLSDSAHQHHRQFVQEELPMMLMCTTWQSHYREETHRPTTLSRSIYVRNETNLANAWIRKLNYLKNTGSWKIRCIVQFYDFQTVICVCLGIILKLG